MAQSKEDTLAFLLTQLQQDFRDKLLDASETRDRLSALHQEASGIADFKWLVLGRHFVWNGALSEAMHDRAKKDIETIARYGLFLEDLEAVDGRLDATVHLADFVPVLDALKVHEASAPAVQARVKTIGKSLGEMARAAGVVSVAASPRASWGWADVAVLALPSSAQRRHRKIITLRSSESAVSAMRDDAVATTCRPTRDLILTHVVEGHEIRVEGLRPSPDLYSLGCEVVVDLMCGYRGAPTPPSSRGPRRGRGYMQLLDDVGIHYEATSGGRTGIGTTKVQDQILLSQPSDWLKPGAAVMVRVRTTDHKALLPDDFSVCLLVEVESDC
jgi:hypothetical protein